MLNYVHIFALLSVYEFFVVKFYHFGLVEIYILVVVF